MELVDVLPKDAIRSIDSPEFGADYFGDPDDEVVVVEGDPPRAYPVCVLSHHEVVNDRLAVDGAERPVAVTWCPICGSAVVYDRQVDGRILEFGVSGKLADDALVLYDRETGTEWKQPTGEAIAGSLAGTTLTAVPALLTTWAEFRAGHPGGLVLQPAETGPPRDVYDVTPYERYEAAEAFGLHGMRGTGQPREWAREDLDPKTVVLGVGEGEAAVGYPRPRVEAAGGVLTDTVDGRDVVVVAADGLHAFEDPGFPLAVDGGDAVATGEDAADTDGTGGPVLRGDGTTWNPTTGESADGRSLVRVPARRLFAFAWQDAHGPDAFYERAADDPPA
jgi:hypothetical protein